MARILSVEQTNVKEKIGGRNNTRGRPRKDMTPKTLLARHLQHVTDGKKISQIADLFGMSVNATRTYLTGDMTPRAEALESFIRATGVNRTWLLTGEGQPFDEKPATAAHGKPIIIPAAGRIAAHDTTTVYFDRNSPAMELFARISYATVHGNGLQPLASDGHALILTRERGPRSGDVVAIETADRATYVKRYHADEYGVILSPLHPGDPQPPVRIDWARIRASYVVVGVWFG